MELCKKYSIILFMVLFLVIFAVEAFTASWIEIELIYAALHKNQVEAFTVSWIEIRSIPPPFMTAGLRLSRPPGLQSKSRAISCLCLAITRLPWILVPSFN